MNSKVNYNYGTAARKLDYSEVKKVNNVQKAPKKRVIIKKKPINVKMISITTVMLVLAMFIVYRYNVISEKNLMAIDFKEELVKQESNISQVIMNNHKNVDILEVEAYAKQKLGMQKPDKNQVVYIDTMTNGLTRNSANGNFFTEFIEMIKQFINM